MRPQNSGYSQPPLGELKEHSAHGQIHRNGARPLPRLLEGLIIPQQSSQACGHHAACRRVISANATCPISVNEYGARRSRPVFSTRCFRLRYCISAFIDWCGICNVSVTSLILSAPESEIAESTLRTRSDSTGRRGSCARRADRARWGCFKPAAVIR
jgi:hypothetical protein